MSAGLLWQLTPPAPGTTLPLQAKRASLGAPDPSGPDSFRRIAS